MVVAIDGPAGSGKSSTAKSVAKRLGFLFLDTGAMYRAVTLKGLRSGIEASDSEGLGRMLEKTEISFEGRLPDVRVLLDGEDVTKEIRGHEVTSNVSDYCKPAVVREALVEQQRLAARGESIVCEGRDIGTVVFPDAEVKFFMDASISERAKRRMADLEKAGIKKSMGQLEKEIEERDRKDSSRSNSPLKRAEDAIALDTTGLDFDEQVNIIIKKIEEKRES